MNEEKQKTGLKGYISTEKVRNKLKELNCKLSPEFINELNKKIDLIITKSAQRATGNGRVTVRGVDL